MTTTIDYEGHTIKIVQKFLKKSFVYYILIDERPITFVEKKAYAISIAKRYIDTISDEYHAKSWKSAKMGRHYPVGNC